METIFVGIGEYKVVKTPSLLESISLGSCVGIVLYDPLSKISGMAHTMLPNSALSSLATTSTPAKFVDKAISIMLEEMKKCGAGRGQLVAKIAGGAYMFQSAMPDPAMNIGARNVEAAKLILTQEKIPLLAEDTGKNYGRTMQFNSETGMMIVKSAKFGIKEM